MNEPSNRKYDAQNAHDFTHTERMHGACVTPQRLILGDSLGRAGPAAVSRHHIHGMLFQHRRWIRLLEFPRSVSRPVDILCLRLVNTYARRVGDGLSFFSGDTLQITVMTS